jgi:hypothetical protein
MQRTHRFAVGRRFGHSGMMLGSLLAVGLASAAPAAAPPATTNVRVQEKPTARVGQIFIVGNEVTHHNVILRELPLFPGGILYYPDLKQAEKKLTSLDAFKSGAKPPTVTVIDNPSDPDNPYKDILISVQETAAGSLMFGDGVNSDNGLTGSIVLNERNFDIHATPPGVESCLTSSWADEWVKDFLLRVQEASLSFWAGAKSDDGITGSIHSPDQAPDSR